MATEILRTHDRRCVAAAVIAAVENLRDDHDGHPHLSDFRAGVEAPGLLLSWADGYLADGLMPCTCAPATVPGGRPVIRVTSVADGRFRLFDDPDAADEYATEVFYRDGANPRVETVTVES